MEAYDDPLYEDPARLDDPHHRPDFSDPRFFEDDAFGDLPPGASPLDDFEALFTDMRKELALEWIRENQTLAILGAFGVGVFMGVLMRR